MSAAQTWFARSIVRLRAGDRDRSLWPCAGLLVLRPRPGAPLIPIRRISRWTRFRFTNTPSPRSIAVIRREPRKGHAVEQFVDPARQRSVVVVGRRSRPVDARARHAKKRALSPRSDSVLVSAVQSIALRSGALIFRTSWLKISLHRELTDLGVQPLDLPLVRRFRIPPDTQVEGPRRLILQLLLPGT